MKKVHVSHMTIISLSILLLSICGTAACIISMIACHYAKPLADFSKDSLKSGKYVSGTITSYVISPLDKRPTRDGDSYFGNLLDMWGRLEYLGYLVPFNEEQYIRIWIKDEKSLALLRETQDGYHVNVPFTGRIERNDIPVDYTDEQLGFDRNKVNINRLWAESVLEIFYQFRELSGIVSCKAVPFEDIAGRTHGSL